jgi:K+-sensing histidine kinase KdpD
MAMPFTCLTCSSRLCEKSKPETFDICQYGISFFNRGGVVEAKEPKVPLSTIAKNLRHEINPILQLIIEQASILDPNLSTRVINLSKPLSIIVGSTVILDNFIQMITGVHEFHSLPNISANKRINLNQLITSTFNIYSIIKEDGRTKGLMITNLVSPNIHVSLCSDFIKYIIAILIDNAWKYSLNNTTLTINLNLISKNKYSLKFTNKSYPLSSSFNPIEMGSKMDSNSKGFGYGLNWAKTLESNYNSHLNLNPIERFTLTHQQTIPSSNPSFAFQEFALNNIILEDA